MNYTFPFGIYELNYTATLNITSSLRTPRSAFVRITLSSMTINLVPLGTSMITQGSGQALQLNPGLYSVDPDGDQFNASDWNYQYYCRIYGLSNFPSIRGVSIPVDDARLDQFNSSCLNNRSGRIEDRSPVSLLLIFIAFEDNGSLLPWRFEVVYSFPTQTSSSPLNFMINQLPRNGSCSIDPANGTTLTLFTVSCPDWFDEDGIKDHSLYRSSSSIASTSHSSLRTLIAFSPASIYEVHLPAAEGPLQLVIRIRDNEDCSSEWTNLTSISVRTDSNILDDLMKSHGRSTTNPFVRLLNRGHPNQVAQVITSLSLQINRHRYLN